MSILSRFCTYLLVVYRDSCLICSRQKWCTRHSSDLQISYLSSNQQAPEKEVSVVVDCQPSRWLDPILATSDTPLLFPHYR